MPLKVSEIRDDLLRKLGIEAADATDSDRAELAVALNWALQVMHQAGEQFYGRKKITVSASTAETDLVDSIQSVLGPVRLATGTPLRRLASRGEFDAYGPLFLGQASYSVAAGTPEAYLVERLDGGISGSDRLQLRLCLVPAPSAPMNVVVEGVEEIERYTAAQFVVGVVPDPVVSVPNQWAESILLPLARYALTRSNQFSRAELRAELEKDYIQAMRTLGLVTEQPADENT